MSSELVPVVDACPYVCIHASLCAYRHVCTHAYIQYACTALHVRVSVALLAVLGASPRLAASLETARARWLSVNPVSIFEFGYL